MPNPNKPDTLGFWAAGASKLLDALDAAESSQMADLVRQLDATSDTLEQDRIRRLILQTQADFQQKRRNAKRSLFAT